MKTKIQALVTSIAGLAASYLGALYIPTLLLVACNIIDYVTGIAAAPFRTGGSVSSYKSIRGITKKVAQWFLIVVGAILDQLIAYTTDLMGWRMPISFLVACVVAIWLICNELISILENVQDIGVSLPAFLLPLVKHIKSQTEEAAELKEDD